ncbi:MAG: hypothetical protein IJ743_03930 [Bacilli bacterium]|nr:hypothetical protein [Bacilli bacterium]
MKLERFKEKNQKKNSIIILVVGLVLLVGFVFFSTSFAVYEDIKNFNIIEGNILDPKDIMIISFLNNNPVENIPTKSNNTILNFSKSKCNNGATIEWNEVEWQANVENITQKRTKCSLYFETVYTDSTGAHAPELHEGMIPIKFDGTTMKTADVSTDAWYDYASHNWANAALINNADTTIKNKFFNSDGSVKTNVIVDVNDLLQMYVWIPRYRYKLWNATMGASNPQAIEIEFESKDQVKKYGSTNGEWLTHPAFTFGETELNGIWVGKFEMTGTESQPTILPNQQSLTNLNVSQMFYSLYNMSSTTYGINKEKTDTHMMKSMEWGAVAYLSHSIYGRYQNSSTCISSGCEVWINNINTGYGNLTQQSSNQPQYGPGITGCSGDSVSAAQNANKTACENGYDWTTLGVNASTTGNIYGIYDMSGGTWEYVMGVMLDSDNMNARFLNSQFSSANIPDRKYYDKYLYYDINASSGTGYMSDAETLARYHLGEGTREIVTQIIKNSNEGWYNDFGYVTDASNTWVSRGGRYTASTTAGTFTFVRFSGVQDYASSFRAVLSRN